jgi:branched-chain amino acid aminotransferase
MQTRIYVDGTITDETRAVVPVLDRGFLYGDGVYEVTLTANGRPVDLGPHLDRLERSAERIALALPARRSIEDAVTRTLADAGCRPGADAYIRVIVTRGGGEIGPDPALADQPRLVIIVKPVSRPSASSVENGVSVRIVSVERTSPRALDPAVKSGNYLNNILGIAEARKSRAYEAVLCGPDGNVAEGSTSNIWCVRGGEVLTPATGMLPGITRWRLMQLAAGAGIPVREAAIAPDELRSADEVFLTSSIRGVLPVSQVDDRALPVGPVTRRLVALYEAFLYRHEDVP